MNKYDQLFPVGIPATGKYLINREEELEELENMLSGGQSVVLISPRRFGKTSICLELLHRLKKRGYFTAHLDIFGVLNKLDLASELVEKTLENKKLRHFVKTLKERASELFGRLEFKQIVKEFEFILKFADEKKNEWELLKKSLDFPDQFAKRYRKKMVVVIDEFGDLSKLNGTELLKLMRSIVQPHKHAVYLFTGSQESVMQQLFLSRRQPFFRFGTIMTLNPLPGVEIRKYIAARFSELKIKIGTEALESMTRATGDYPYYTQLLCQRAYFTCLRRKRSLIDPAIVAEARLQILTHEKNFFDELWFELMEWQGARQLLRAIVFNVGPLYAVEALKGKNLARLMKTLKDKGIIARRAGKYEVSDPFFREYLAARFAEKYL